MISKLCSLSNSRFCPLLVLLIVIGLLASTYPVQSAPAPSAANNPGDLDPTFGSGGIVTTPIGNSNDQAYDVIVQPDGRVLVMGNTQNGSDWGLALARYTRTGELDPTFGNSGVVTASISSTTSWFSSFALQPDGKILVAGATDNGSDKDFALLRYTPSGELDATFGSGGVVTTPIGSGSDSVSGVGLQPDGKIVVAGASHNGSDHDFALVRYTPSGALDATFGSGGIVTTPIGAGNDQADSVAIQSDGKIVVVGTFQNGNGLNSALVRYTPSGALDATFGSSGIVVSPIAPARDRAHHLALQPDGKILVVGTADNGSNWDISLVRYTVSGKPDVTFGSGGIVTTLIGDGDDKGSDLVLQPDGKILVTGRTENGSNADFALLRYTISGVLDASFGNGGIVTTPIGNGDDRAWSIALQRDGRVVVAGLAENGNDEDFALARYYAYPTYPIYLPHVAR